jgi:hypothetical protein
MSPAGRVLLSGIRMMLAVLIFQLDQVVDRCLTVLRHSAYVVRGYISSAVLRLI